MFFPPRDIVEKVKKMYTKTEKERKDGVTYCFRGT